MKKIIFLDVDGVLNSLRNILAFKRFPWPAVAESEEAARIKFTDLEKPGIQSLGCGPESELDPLAIGMIRRLCEETGAKIVLHSMWRRHVDPIKFGERHNLPIIDSTFPNLEKIQSIDRWLGDHPGVTHFTIIDDDSITDPSCRIDDRTGWEIHPQRFDLLASRHVRTSMIHGFGFNDFIKCGFHLTDLDEDTIRQTNDKLARLRAANFALGYDDKTEKEREEILDQIEEILNSDTDGGAGIIRWAVSVADTEREDI